MIPSNYQSLWNCVCPVSVSLSVCISVSLSICISGPQLHSVKTASIGTLGRVRPPMSVTVPSAPDVPETSKMLEDVDSVSTAPPRS